MSNYKRNMRVQFDPDDKAVDNLARQMGNAAAGQITRASESVTIPRDLNFVEQSRTVMDSDDHQRVVVEKETFKVYPPAVQLRAEEYSFAPSNGVPSIDKLNDYLKEYRLSHPNAALLQMIPTAPNTYLFVWES